MQEEVCRQPSRASRFRMIGYDYGAKKYVSFGEFADYEKYMK